MLGNIVILACLILSSTARSGDQNAGVANASDGETGPYKTLYYSRVVSDLAKFTALLTRLDQGDYKTTKNVMILSLKGDLRVIGLETNYPWSEDQKKALSLAQDYLKQDESKK